VTGPTILTQKLDFWNLVDRAASLPYHGTFRGVGVASLSGLSVELRTPASGEGTRNTVRTNRGIVDSVTRQFGNPTWTLDGDGKRVVLDEMPLVAPLYKSGPKKGMA
jgi:hypothetical protein